MTKGLVYDVVMYPAFINLNKGELFEITKREKFYGIVVRNHVNALGILEFDNELLINKNDTHEDSFSASMANNVDPIANKHFVQRVGANSYKVIDFKGEDEIYNSRVISNELYTELVIIYESEDIEAENENNENLFEDVLDEFLLLYKDVAKQPNIRQINDLNDQDMTISRAVRAYDENEETMSFQEIINGDHDIAPLPLAIKTAPKIGDVIFNKEDVETISNIMQTRIDEEDFLDDIHSMLGKAAEELYTRNNYKYAFLDIFFAIESFIMQEVWEYKNRVLVKAGRSFPKNDGIKFPRRKLSLPSVFLSFGSFLLSC